MKRRLSGKAKKHHQKLSRTLVNLALAPGTPRTSVPAIHALASAAGHQDLGNFAAATFICRQLLACPQAVLDALIILLEIALRQNRPAETKQYCEQLLQAGSRPPHATSTLVNALRSMNRYDEAVEITEKAVRDEPTDPELKHLLAVLLIELNETGRATTLLRNILKIDDTFLPAYRHLAVLNALTDSEVTWLENVAANSAARPPPLAALIALAITFRQRGDIDREFHYLELAHRGLAASPTCQPADEDRRTETLMTFFDDDFFRRHKALPGGACQPIFIVGMPRSGSTLTEQILATADGIAAIGEPKLFHWTLHDLCERRFGNIPYLDAVRRFEPADFAELANDYCHHVASIYTPARRFIDKQLDNYPFLGVMHLAFPGARFIHTLRNPLDTCLSTYQQVFSQIEAGHSLQHLAVKYRNHVAVMNHWKRHLAKQIFTVAYEDLVSDPQRHARALFEFCDIPWNQNALNFHARDSGVRTASLMQVRQPIYGSSVQKWRRYAAHLGPVFRELNLRPDGSAAGPAVPA